MAAASVILAVASARNQLVINTNPNRVVLEAAEVTLTPLAGATTGSAEGAGGLIRSYARG